MKIEIEERVFHFRQPAGTSRGVYTTRRSWFVTLRDGEKVGVGECAPLPDLSCDAVPDYGERLRVQGEAFLSAVQQDEEAVDAFFETLRDYPSMLFGFETALLAVRSQSSEVGGQRSGVPMLFDTPFSRGEVGIPINGLVWMGSYEEMLGRMEEKLAQGYRCVKLKVGAIDFDRELELVKRIRERFSRHEVELRLDANGGFEPQEALYKLELLSQYAIHSIEQPIKAKQWAMMAELCRDAPLPIALDEELIGINDPDAKRQMLRIVKPAYIVLKPSLHGGMMGCREWMTIAREEGIGSWITSALESNVGLNAIAQFCSSVTSLPKGRSTSLQKEGRTSLQKEGSTSLQKEGRTSLPKGSTSPQKGSTSPQKGRTSLQKGRTSPQKGSTGSVYGDSIAIPPGSEMMPQGLGTGQLFTDNIPMPLTIINNELWISKHS